MTGTWERNASEAAAMLAMDEAMLARRKESQRLWESAFPFVVLGRSCKAEADVDLAACAKEGIPVVRRGSGGGTVLQGPGCLNYSLVLDLEKRPRLQNVEESYEAILGWVAGVLGVEGLRICGSDMMQGDRKISGNAQRRTRGWLLHHGTLLYGLDLELMGRVLREPERQPAHRRGKGHGEFLGKLPMHREEFMKRWEGCIVLPELGI